jgi:hypothetical protein
MEDFSPWTTSSKTTPKRAPPQTRSVRFRYPEIIQAGLTKQRPSSRQLPLQPTTLYTVKSSDSPIFKAFRPGSFKVYSSKAAKLRQASLSPCNFIRHRSPSLKTSPNPHRFHRRVSHRSVSRINPMEELQSIILHSMHEVASQASSKLKDSRLITRRTKPTDFGVIGTKTLQ